MKKPILNTQYEPLQTTGIRFAPVIDLPEDYEVYDFTGGYDPNRTLASQYGIGRYNEVRPGMYEGEQFEGIRNIHVGIDIAAPAQESVHFFPCRAPLLLQMTAGALRKHSVSKLKHEE